MRLWRPLLCQLSYAPEELDRGLGTRPVVTGSAEPAMFAGYYGIGAKSARKIIQNQPTTIGSTLSTSPRIDTIAEPTVITASMVIVITSRIQDVDEANPGAVHLF